MLTSEQWAEVRTLFDEALDLEPGERRAFAKGVQTSPEIRQVLEDMIESHDRARAMRHAEEAGEPEAVFRPGDLVAGGRYRVVEVRGRGGMGEVYKVSDQRLGTISALKTIRADWATSPEARQRFRREISLAREVSHENVCNVYDLVEHAESGSVVPCLSMEWLEGETLQAHLEKARPWKPEEALGVLRQIASALDALHKAKIIHRDLKPGNVILAPQKSGGWRAVVTDFGLAQPAARGEAPDPAAGAPYFMAPELLNEGEPGFASDIYAFGLIIDEMMTRSRAFTAGSLMKLYYQKLHEAPVRPSERNPELPPVWEAVILRCIDRTPEKRYARAGDAIAELDPPAKARTGWPARIAAVAALLAIAVTIPVLTALWFPPSDVSLVVFRIRDLTEDPSIGYLPGALTGEVMNQLAAVKGLAVKPFHGVQSDDAERRIEDRLQLDGDLQKHESQVRLRVRLTDREQGIVWVGSFDRGLENPLAFQTDAVREVTRGVGGYIAANRPGAGVVQRAGYRLIDLANSLRRPEAGAPAATRNPAAFHAYLRALQLMEERRPESVRAAIQSLESAVGEDPEFGLALAALSDACRNMVDMKQGAQEEMRARALSYARKAVAVNPNLPEAHAALAATLQMDWDWKGAEASYREAIRLAPRSPAAYRRMGGLVLQFGRTDEALALFQKGLELDPYDYPAHSAYGLSLKIARRYEDAERHLVWTLKQRDIMSAHVNLGPVYALRGEAAGNAKEADRYFRLALAEAEAVARLETAGVPKGMEPKTPSSDYMFAMIHAMRGDKAKAERALQRMLANESLVKNSPVSFALVYGILRQPDRAINYLRLAAKVRDRGLLYLKVLPHWDPLREEEGFQEILRAMRL